MDLAQLLAMPCLAVSNIVGIIIILFHLSTAEEHELLIPPVLASY